MKVTKNYAIILTVLAVLALAPVGPALGEGITLREPENKSIVDSDTPAFSWTDSGAAVYELTIWRKDGASITHHTFISSPGYIVPGGVLGEGATYLWAIKGKEALTSPARAESSRWEFSVKSRADDGRQKEGFIKTGNTLVVPVAFSDVTFESLDIMQGVSDLINLGDTNQGKLREIIDRKMSGLKRYYEICSGNSTDVEQIEYDIAPVVKLAHSRKRYADDKLKPGKYFWHALSKKNWLIDCGAFPGDHDGFAKLMQETLKELLSQGIPVTEYYHIMYLVPGSGGNMPGSNQVWPATYGPSPRTRIRYRELDGEVTGYHCGIVMGLKSNTGTYCHEYGHEYGLPDLYPYPSTPQRSLKAACLMASGNQKGEYGTGFTTLSQKKSLAGRGPEYKQDDWIAGRFEIMSESGTRVLSPRDSDGDLVGIAVPTGQTDYAYYVVECFDRKGLDKDLPALVTPGQALASLNPFGSPGILKCRAGVIVYKVDDLDVRAIKKAKLIGITGATQESLVSKIPLLNKVFLDGGKIKAGRSTIEILKVEKSGDRYRARIKVTLR